MSHPSSQQVLSTIIAARPGVTQESLRATLATSRRVEIVGSAGDESTMLTLVAAREPALLVLDHGLVADGKIAALLRHLKQEYASLQCLVLTETDGQGVQALAAGATAVLLRHDPTVRWQETLDRLAERSDNQDRQQ